MCSEGGGGRPAMPRVCSEGGRGETCYTEEVRVCSEGGRGDLLC